MKKKLYRWLISIKVSALLMTLLVGLFLLNVLVPQARTHGPEAIENMAAESAIKHFFLVDLGFGDMASSPIFIATLAFFFLNLTAVLVHRAASTAKRIKAKMPSEAKLMRQAKGKDALSYDRPEGWEPEGAAAILKKLGYEVSRPGGHTLFAEKNRRALLGFIVFHVSFFPMLAGGLLLYYTRSEVVTVAAEGQSFNVAEGRVHRVASWGGVPDKEFTLVEVEPMVDAEGRHIQLAATLAWIEDGQPESGTIMVNHPVSRGHLDVLVDQVGLAATLRVFDERGAILDRISMPAPVTDANVRLVPVADYALEVEFEPIPVDASFPRRAELATTAMELSIWSEGEEVFRGELRPGEFARVGNYTLRIDEIKYWVRLRLVAERGGWILIFGFALGVVGIVWRMLFVKREVGLSWSDEKVTVFGRSEFYKSGFQHDLEALGAVLMEQEHTKMIES